MLLLSILLLEIIAQFVVSSGEQCLYSAEEHCMKDTEVIGNNLIYHQTLKPSDCGEFIGLINHKKIKTKQRSPVDRRPSPC